MAGDLARGARMALHWVGEGVGQKALRRGEGRREEREREELGLGRELASQNESMLFLGGLLFFLMKAGFSWVGCFSLKENKVFDRSGIWGPCPPEPILSYNCTCSPGPYSYDDKVL